MRQAVARLADPGELGRRISGDGGWRASLRERVGRRSENRGSRVVVPHRWAGLGGGADVGVTAAGTIGRLRPECERRRSVHRSVRSAVRRATRSIRRHSRAADRLRTEQHRRAVQASEGLRRMTKPQGPLHLLARTLLEWVYAIAGFPPVRP